MNPGDCKHGLTVRNCLECSPTWIGPNGPIPNPSRIRRNIPTGIASALLELAQDEGREQALKVAERWRNTLEEMSEVANADQRAAIMSLVNACECYIGIAVEEMQREETTQLQAARDESNL